MLKPELWDCSNLWSIRSYSMPCVVWFIEVQHQEVWPVTIRQTEPVYHSVHSLLVRNIPVTKIIGEILEALLFVLSKIKASFIMLWKD